MVVTGAGIAGRQMDAAGWHVFDMACKTRERILCFASEGLD